MTVLCVPYSLNSGVQRVFRWRVFDGAFSSVFEEVCPGSTLGLKKSASSPSFAPTDYSKVDKLASWHRSVNFEVKRALSCRIGEPKSTIFAALFVEGCIIRADLTPPVVSSIEPSTTCLILFYLCRHHPGMEAVEGPTTV